MTETAQTTFLIQRDGYAIYQAGKHAEGAFIRVYIPDGAPQPGSQSRRSLTSMGFRSVCPPSMNSQHAPRWRHAKPGSAR